MKFYVSYFYAVRFMKPNTVALSTAMSPPKWFGRKPYWDKRGVMNGLTATPFVPTPNEETKGISCGNCDHNPLQCLLTKSYKAQLAKLDFEDMMCRFESIAERVVTNGEEPEIVLLVHEAPDNPCSERWLLFDWFHSHGIDAQEYPIPRVKRKVEKTYNF